MINVTTISGVTFIYNYTYLSIFCVLINVSFDLKDL